MLATQWDETFHTIALHKGISGALGDVLKRIGDENVVISTDYPHADSHWPDAINHFMTMEMPSASRKKILWDNCTRLYGVS
jgi:predicted TIM-barrel fold metal-dependent hydrolase